MSAALAEWEERLNKERQIAKDKTDEAQREEERKREAEAERRKFEATARRAVLMDGKPTQIHSGQVFTDVQKACESWSLREHDPAAFRGEAHFDEGDNDKIKYEVSLQPDGNATMFFQAGTGWDEKHYFFYEGQMQYRVLDDKTIGFFIGTLNPVPDGEGWHGSDRFVGKDVRTIFEILSKGTMGSGDEPSFDSFEKHFWGPAATKDLQ